MCHGQLRARATLHPVGLSVTSTMLLAVRVVFQLARDFQVSRMGHGLARGSLRSPRTSRRFSVWMSHLLYHVPSRCWVVRSSSRKTSIPKILKLIGLCFVFRNKSISGWSVKCVNAFVHNMTAVVVAGQSIGSGHGISPCDAAGYH